MKFRILDGKHHQGGKTYKKGQVVSTDLPLDKMFKNKFQRADFVVPEDDDAPKASKKVVIGKKKDKPDAAKDARGTDVTAKFKLPKDAEGILVFQRGEVFHLYEEGETKPLNPTGLTEDKVRGFVKTYLES